MKKRKPLPLALAIAVLVVSPPFAVILWLESSSGQRFIERRVSAATGREVTMGDLDIKVGWRPGVQVRGLRVTNPEWARTSHLIDTDLIDARLRLLPLLTGRVIFGGAIPRPGEGWPRARARPQYLVLQETGRRREQAVTRVRAKDPHRSGPYRVSRYDHSHGPGYRRHRQCRRRWQDRSGCSRNGARPENTSGGELPGRAADAGHDGRDVGCRRDRRGPAAAAGRVRAADVDGIDLDLDISGASLGDLKKLVQLNLPDTPPYRLQGRFRNPAGSFIFDPFEGRVGDGDLSGAAQYTRGGKRPVLKAKLVSHLLDLDDLGPVVGAPPKTGPGETAAPKQKQQVQQIEASGKVLPQKRFEVEDFPLMDADVRFEGKRILDAGPVPIEDLSAHWVLDNRVLK